MFPFETLEEKYQNIPNDVREAISSTEVSEKLKSIVDKYKLQFDEGEELTKEIGYVMLGLKSPDYFVRNIQNATNLNQEQAKEIVKDVNEMIFKNIKESLREIHDKRNFVEDEKIEDLNEEIQEKMRDELMQEIETPKTKKILLENENSEDILPNPEQTQINTITTDIIEKPEQELQKTVIISKDKKEVSEQTSIQTDKQESTTTNKEELIKSNKENEQNQSKKYIMDPYREPLE